MISYKASKSMKEITVYQSSFDGFRRNRYKTRRKPNDLLVFVKRVADGRKKENRKIIDEEREESKIKNKFLISLGRQERNFFE